MAIPRKAARSSARCSWDATRSAAGYVAEINARYSRLFPIKERKSAEFLVEIYESRQPAERHEPEFDGDGGYGGQHHDAGTAGADRFARSASAAAGRALQLVGGFS